MFWWDWKNNLFYSQNQIWLKHILLGRNAKLKFWNCISFMYGNLLFWSGGFFILTVAHSTLKSRNLRPSYFAKPWNGYPVGPTELWTDLTLPCFATDLVTHENWLTDELANSMKPSPSKSNRRTACQEILCLLWDLKVYFSVHKSSPLAFILRQTDPIHALWLYFCKIHSNIILLHTPRSPKWFPPYII